MNYEEIKKLCDLVPHERLVPTFDEIIQEIERLQNIIDEFENYLFTQLQLYGGGGGIVQEYYDKLKELKEGNKDE